MNKIITAESSETAYFNVLRESRHRASSISSRAIQRRRLMNFKANKLNDDFFRVSTIVFRRLLLLLSRVANCFRYIMILSRSMIALINIYVIWARAKQVIAGGCRRFWIFNAPQTRASLAPYTWLWRRVLAEKMERKRGKACIRHRTKQQSYSSCQWQFHHRLECHSDFSLLAGLVRVSCVCVCGGVIISNDDGM